MTDPDKPQEAHEDELDEDEEYASTPFDNPFFLPVILLGLFVWAVYDGWFNPDFEWIQFNRVLAVVTGVLGGWLTWRAIQERRAERESDGSDPS